MAWEPVWPEAILSDGLMYAGSKVLIYGKYKSMKSMLMLNFSLQAAKGQPWLEFKTPEDGVSILYLQSEVPHAQLQGRFKDMLNGGHSHVRQPFWIWTEPVLKLDKQKDLDKVRKVLGEHKPSILILDPVYKLLSGNILDASSVTTFIDVVDQLIAEFNLSVMAVSHSRKSAAGEDGAWGSDSMLGSVLFSAWADTVIEVIKGGNTLDVKFDVVRHARKELKPKKVDINNLKFSVITGEIKL